MVQTLSLGKATRETAGMIATRDGGNDRNGPFTRVFSGRGDALSEAWPP